MSVISTLLTKGRSMAGHMHGGGRAPTGPRHVAVLEHYEPGSWRLVEGQVGGDRPTVSSARILKTGGSGSAPGRIQLNGASHSNDVALVSSSARSVCRFVEMVEAPDDQIRQMVALRLETELPYPVEEAVWVCERRAGHNADGNVLVVATASEDVERDESVLRASGLRSGTVEFAPAGLAELAVSCTPSGESAAIACVGREGADLAVVHGGALRYTRRLTTMIADADDPSLTELDQLANEMHQSIYDYAFRANGAMPERIFVTGCERAVPLLMDRLRGQFDVQVAEVPWEEHVAVADGAVVEGSLMCEYAACTGALLALHRRAAGQATAAPPLRAGKRRAATAAIRTPMNTLVAANVVLAVVLVAALFAVRAARLQAVESAIDESRPYLTNLDRLQEEVDVLKYEDRRGRSVLDAFLALSEALPPDVKISSLTIDSKNKVTMSGMTKKAESASQKALQGIAASDRLLNPKFLGANKDKEGFTFSITCEVRLGSGGSGQ
ncbi:MAG: hypothetical protein GY851_30085 [bacterium]|nr:hypothetical protein [bacterium]